MAVKKINPLAEIDIRILERKLRRGEITPEQFAEAQASFPESSEGVELDEEKLLRPPTSRQP